MAGAEVAHDLHEEHGEDAIPEQREDERAHEPPTGPTAA
jgi:hypothetical protein